MSNCADAYTASAVYGVAFIDHPPISYAVELSEEAGQRIADDSMRFGMDGEDYLHYVVFFGWPGEKPVAGVRSRCFS